MDAVLAAAAAVEQGSDHPLAQAIVRRAEGLTVPDADGIREHRRHGRAGRDRRRDRVPGQSPADGDAKARSRRAWRRGQAPARCGPHGGLRARAGKRHRPHRHRRCAPANRKATVAKLRERGIQVAMLTGDNAGTAQRIAKDLGIDIVFADVLPGQKAGKVKELQAQGKKVGMVGDGVNDAPALTQADVGFAIGAGTDVAIESADVVLMKSDPYDVVGAVELSRATLRKMHQNLWWAVGYNVNCVPPRCRRLLSSSAQPRDRRPCHVGKLGAGGDQCADAEAHQATWITRYRSMQVPESQVAEADHRPMKG